MGLGQFRGLAPFPTLPLPTLPLPTFPHRLLAGQAWVAFHQGLTLSLSWRPLNLTALLSISEDGEAEEASGWGAGTAPPPFSSHLPRGCSPFA